MMIRQTGARARSSWKKVVTVLCASAFATVAPRGAADFDRSIQPILKAYCVDCHSADLQKGDLDLERFKSLSDAKREPKIWQNIIEQVTNGEMPPKKKDQPSEEEKERLLASIRGMLDEIALASAGDPGPVVLRRLSNAEYTYTVRDLTGVDSLDPAREFPADGAAGEGFMNVGNSLVMSPALVTKYLDAGKDIASHLVLLPDGARFSEKSSRRDWTEETLAGIRDFYARYTDAGGGDKVNLQGIVFETNEGGRLPLEKYLEASLLARDSGERSIEAMARERGLSPKYLVLLIRLLDSGEPSLLLDPIRARWRSARPEEARALAAEIGQWQKTLWKFNSVGHIGKLNGPKSWMEPVVPLASRQAVRTPLPAAGEGKGLKLYLVASDAGDGNTNDFVIWEQPRFVSPGRPDLLLRDVAATREALVRWRDRMFASTAKILGAAAEAGTMPEGGTTAGLAAKHGIEEGDLGPWLDYLGIRPGETVQIDSYFTNAIRSASNYDFIRGWGSADTPSVLANSSDEHVRIPGNMKPGGIAVHPAPSLGVAAGWRSPVGGVVQVAGTIQHAHPECGNGVTWRLELRRGATRQRLASGIAQGGNPVKTPPLENIRVRAGDLLALVIGPRDGNHSCDLTAVDLVVTSDEGREWNLAADVSPDILAGNPHADRFGHEAVWHFYTEPEKSGGKSAPVIPAGSLLAKWQEASEAGERARIAEQLQALLLTGGAAADSPDGRLYEQLASLSGPLLGGLMPQAESLSAAEGDGGEQWGLDPARFGKAAGGSVIDPASLAVRAPAVIEIRLPADLVRGREFVTAGTLDPERGREGTVQFQVLTNAPSGSVQVVPGGVTVTQANGPWTSNNQQVSYGAPIIVKDGSEARKRVEASFDEFRANFPAALCYTKIVPVDEVVTLTLYYREDDHLARLMLDDAEQAVLNRLWDELHFVSQDALTLVDAYEQLWQFATQDADPKVFEPLREPIQARAAAFRQLLKASETNHVRAVEKFADRAYRRPLTEGERDELGKLYRRLLEQELPHEEAIRLMVARVLISPSFLYRTEKPGPGLEPSPVNDWELASRLSYFLWSSMPDEELRETAARGLLRDPEVLAGQARRMSGDARVRRMAIEFGCAWLHIHGFDELDEKSERHFPTFAGLRGAMYEESIQFFTHFFQEDASVLDLLDADYTYLNEDLARHYGIPGVTGAEWRRVEGVKTFARGGILAQAATLAKQSGASRTSPILRGNWVAEVLLGDKLPRPPKDVPQLPEDEASEHLSVRELTQKHSSDPRCYGCHKRIDPFGYSLEAFDAIGRHRERDLGGRAIDTRVKALDGAEFEGIEGLRQYLLEDRRATFVRQFCRKLLGYALGRAVQLSDEPLLGEMASRLAANDYRIGAAIEAIVKSRQFREIRGRDMVAAD